MSEQRLLKTYEDFHPEVITEDVEVGGVKKQKMILKGIIQRSDALNQNGRIYPRNILEREIRNYQKFINENRALGELDHPDTSVVELKNVSHIVREAIMDRDGIVHGRVEILDTPSGKIAQDLVKGGVKIGISSRGVGSTEKKGEYTYVAEDFILIAFDLVCDPSTPGAFLLPEGRRISTDERHKILTQSDRISRLATQILGIK